MRIELTGRTIFKALLLILAIFMITISGLVYTENSLTSGEPTEEIQMIEKQQDNKLIEIFREISTLPSENLKDRMKLAIEKDYTDLFAGLIIFVITAISFFVFKQYEKNYGMMLFGVYSGFAQSILYNIISLGCIETMNFHFAFENTLLGMISGTLAGAIVTTICLITRFLNNIPEPDMTKWELVVLKLRFYLFGKNAVSLQSWILIGIIISGIALILV